MVDKVAHLWKEFLDSLNSKGGGIFIVLLIFYTSPLMYKWLGIVELKEVIIFAAGSLTGLAGGERLANNKKSIDIKETKEL